MYNTIEQQLINLIKNKLDGLSPFLTIKNNIKNSKIYTIENNNALIINDDIDISNVYNKVIEYEKSSVIFHFNDYTTYNITPMILNAIILNLTMLINTKNHYIIRDNIEEEIQKIIKYNDNINWFDTYETRIEFLSLYDSNNKIKDWSKLNLCGKEIYPLESDFPKSVIIGTPHSLLVNTNEINIIREDNKITVNLPYYYIDDFHAIRIISDESKRLIYLRNKKIKNIQKKIF